MPSVCPYVRVRMHTQALELQNNVNVGCCEYLVKVVRLLECVCGFSVQCCCWRAVVNILKEIWRALWFTMSVKLIVGRLKHNPKIDSVLVV